MSLRIGQKASSSSSSSSSSRNAPFFRGWNFDVFLSFRGEDTRRNFTDHIYTALVEKGIHTFRDDEELERGERINQKLEQAIEESRIFIVIFSENYANSKWCLNELVKIMECGRRRGRKVFPIFYHVDPSHVRDQSGIYGTAFADYGNDVNLEREQIQKWRSALTEAGHLAGYHLENQYETEMIRQITRDMLCEIIGEHCDGDGLVGKKPRLEALKELISKAKDVVMVGIYGLSGIGKTTIARALYDEIACQFEGASFLANIGEISKKDSLCCLHKRLLSDVLLGGECQEMLSHSMNSLLMKDKIRCKKVLIVLDDVNDLKQLQILAGNHDWFGKGSRIIITTKNKHILYQHKVDEFYEPTPLDPREALELFSHHANSKEESLFDFYALSKQVMSYCDHHPLALQVVGSFLRGKSYLQWQVQLENLARENLNVLRVSYDGLSHQEQHMFLDAACFFKGEYKDFVTKMLNRHDFSAENGVQVLTGRGLITISERKLWMQSIIQQLGWQIVRKAGKPCRLWDHMDVQRLLRTKKGMHTVEGLFLDLSKSNQIHFPTEVFAQMTEIRLLKIFLGSDCVEKENFAVNISTDFSHPWPVLRYLYWHGYQLERFSSLFEARQLLELHMPYSRLKLIKGYHIDFPKLTILNLSHSQSLEDISNFSRMPNLERLVLEGCRRLVKVDQSIGGLKNLSSINLKDCVRLTCLPKSIAKLRFLETLILVGCSRLERLVDELKEHPSLEANPTSTPVVTLPPKLRILQLGHCKRLQDIPLLTPSIRRVDAYNCISIGTLSSSIRLATSMLRRIRVSLSHVGKIPESEFSILLPGNRIPEWCFTHRATGSSVTMELQNLNWYNHRFCGFAVGLVLAQKAEMTQLNPEILCELNNFTIFYSYGEDSTIDEFAESDQEGGGGNSSTDHVWLAYQPRARAERCRPQEWNHIKASFEVFACEVKECAIGFMYK